MFYTSIMFLNHRVNRWLHRSQSPYLAAFSKLKCSMKHANKQFYKNWGYFVRVTLEDVLMISLARAHRALDLIAELPVLRNVARRRYDRVFENNRDRNLFRGVFSTFEEAALSAPNSRPTGYDNADAASMYVERSKKIYPTDYPVMFWLQKLLADGCANCFDLGGHIGVSYYAYRKYLTYPRTLRWTVHDVPAVMAQGRHWASENDRDGCLSFSDDFDAVSGVDVLMAQGSLQYLPDTLADRLAKLSVRPSHILLNLTPLHNTHSYFTLQSIGTAFCPYRITAKFDFIESMQGLGYLMVDHWINPDKRCMIQFHPDHSLEGYHGFYFRRGP